MVVRGRPLQIAAQNQKEDEDTLPPGMLILDYEGTTVCRSVPPPLSAKLIVLDTVLKVELYVPPPYTFGGLLFDGTRYFQVHTCMYRYHDQSWVSCSVGAIQSDRD